MYYLSIHNRKTWYNGTGKPKPNMPESKQEQRVMDLEKNFVVGYSCKIMYVMSAYYLYIYLYLQMNRPVQETKAACAFSRFLL